MSGRLGDVAGEARWNLTRGGTRRSNKESEVLGVVEGQCVGVWRLEFHSQLCHSLTLCPENHGTC